MNAPVDPGTLSFDLELTPEILSEAIKAMSVSELLAGVHSPGTEDRVGHYMYVSTGRLFFPCDPRPEEVDIQDIAVGCSRAFRFNGHTIKPMSVAEHCWHASHLVPPELALEALLHDAAEAYIGDVIRPMKALPVYGALYLKIEKGIETAVAERFKLVYPWPAAVRRADEMLLHAEIAQNIKSKRGGVHFERAVYDREKEMPVEFSLHHWDSATAMTMFTARFAELADLRGLA